MNKNAPWAGLKFFPALRRYSHTAWLLALILVLATAGLLGAQTDDESCMGCHEDSSLESDNGQNMFVPYDLFKTSVHADHGCTDCHSVSGDFEDVPHWNQYTKVECADCHDDAVKSFGEGFHGKARQRGNLRAPECTDCHGDDGNPHVIKGLAIRSAENACRRCHAEETASYDTGVHAVAAAEGKNSPGCVSCHLPHGLGLPPSSGAVNAMCTSCHEGSMEDVKRGGHSAIGEELVDVMNCASCHDVHGTHKPHMSARVSDACVTCHEDEMTAFAGSVHEDLFEVDVMNCLSCHSTHKDEEDIGRFDAGCGACHEDVEEDYRSSVHRMGRLRGDEAAATCADCHKGHQVLAASDTLSTINHRNIPHMCGSCHGADAVVTSEYVRLPISLPNYLKSVHGVGWEAGKKTAVCTDCHGTHDLTTAHDPDSRINTFNISRTCGQCHEEIAETYQGSVHGKALAMGILDSPTCTSCHSEHLIRGHLDPEARISADHRARELCGDCHSRPELIAKYGLPGGVVESYLDTYHGWAISQGNGLVASCTDCHTTHDIRAQLDPMSSIHLNNVTETCGQCHKRSNPTFAQSYSHAGALAARGYHEWAKLIYIFLIAFVLGGMGLHNLLIARYELRKHFKKRNAEPYIMRWGSAERIQHIVLIVSFFGLAITGFALRFSDSWWVPLIGLGGKEFVRMNIHRALAIIMIVVSIYHMVWVTIARRGRIAIKEMVPRGSDLFQAINNVLFYLKIKKERPQFNAYDYTQKAEYWALVWGTWVMVATGFILWFPTLATNYMPAWVVRVAEVVHFYEAILAVSAIIIWHWFFVLFMPHEFPMSTIWVNGRMPAEEWKKNHRGDYLKVGDSAIIDPSRKPDDYVETDANIPGVTDVPRTKPPPGDSKKS